MNSNPDNPEILYQNGQEIKIGKAEFLYDDKLEYITGIVLKLEKLFLIFLK